MSQSEPASPTDGHARPDRVHVVARPVDPGRLEEIRRSGRDDLGQAPRPWHSGEGAPLRCCLRRVRAEDRVLVLSYAPLTEPSPWREVGPVFVHAERCGGYDPARGLPAELRSGPRVLRGYDAGGALRYDAVRVVDEGEDVEAPLEELLADRTVTEIHVRALREQCLTYVATRA